MPNNRRAFTLIELLVVIAIIGMLSTVAVVSTTSAGINARNGKRKADLVQISKALELYYTDNGEYPSSNGVWRGPGYNRGAYSDSGAEAWIPNFQNYWRSCRATQIRTNSIQEAPMAVAHLRPPMRDTAAMHIVLTVLIIRS
jgi:prepilin-type N-terminal cleavage/methylation domain-containing protein